MRLVGYGDEGSERAAGVQPGGRPPAVCGNARPKVSIYSGYGPGALSRPVAAGMNLAIIASFTRRSRLRCSRGMRG